MNDGLGPEGSYYEAKEREKNLKRDAYFPLFIVTLYLILGAVFNLWHPGWLIFFTIPLHYWNGNSAVERITNPVMVTLIYLILGLFFHLWHPGWLIFLIIPFGFLIDK